VKTGQSTTSFHPATGNPIMTSTTCNRYVEPVTEENKTVPYSGYNGKTRGLNRGWGMKRAAYPLITMGGNKGRGRSKSVWVRLLLVVNSLLPLSIRPVKSKRAHRRRYLGIRHRIFTWRMLWRSHWKNKLKAKLRLNK
jgi:hypothetical protein